MKQTLIWILCASTIAMMTALSGCADEPMASNAAAPAGVPSPVPTFNELNAALSLDDADADVVKNALGTWRDDAAKDTKPGFQNRRREMEFVATVSPRLDDAQLNEMVELLVERRGARREAMRAHKKQRHEAKMDARREVRKEGRLDKRIANTGKHVGDRVAWLDTALELTDAQASQVKAALTATAESRKASLEAIKNESATREQARDQMRAAHDKYEESLKGILSAEQQERLEILKRLHPRRHRA